MKANGKTMGVDGRYAIVTANPLTNPSADGELFSGFMQIRSTLQPYAHGVLAALWFKFNKKTLSTTLNCYNTRKFNSAIRWRKPTFIFII